MKSSENIHVNILKQGIDNVLTTKEQLSKKACTLEERVFGRDLKNKNITIRNKVENKEKKVDKKCEGLADKNNKIGYYNILKNNPVFNPEGQKKKITVEEKKSNTNIPINININVMSNIANIQHNFIKIGDNFYRTSLVEKKVKPTEEFLDLALEKCEYERRNDPQYVVEFSHSIFEFLKEIEVKYLFNKYKNINTPEYGCFRTIQNQVNEKMRSILIDWLAEVHFKFQLLPETLFLTVNLLDRYLAKASIETSKFQLLGISSMLIASKYEEIYAPEIRDFVHISDKTYTRQQIIEMESTILSTLSFDILTTSPLKFLERYHFISNDENQKTLLLAQYLLELSMLEYKFITYSPSLKACASLYLSRKVLRIDNTSWSNTLQFHSGFKEKDLKQCAKDMGKILQIIPRISLQSIYKKYSSVQMHEVAKCVYDEKLNTGTIENSSLSNR